MIQKYFKQNGVTVINVVRRQEQVDLLKNEDGAEYVLNSSEENFDQELYEIAKKFKINVALEAVAGEMTGRIMRVLQSGGVVIQYGFLSQDKIGPLDPVVTIFKWHKIEGFLMPFWLMTKRWWNIIGAVSAAKKLAKDVNVKECVGVHQVQEAME